MPSLASLVLPYVRLLTGRPEEAVPVNQEPPHKPVLTNEYVEPYLIIAATPMHLSMKSRDGASVEHRIEAGDLHWLDRKVTHVLANEGTEPGILVHVELR